MTPKKYSVDLLLFDNPVSQDLNWPLGECFWLNSTDHSALIQELNFLVESSHADYLLLWHTAQDLPKPEVLFSIIANGVDIAHCGLKQSLGIFWEDLCLLGFSWDKLNASSEIVSTSWRLGLQASLIRRKLFISIGGLDTVFRSQAGASLELGYRSLKLGAIIEYRPELSNGVSLPRMAEPASHDFYCFVLRHLNPIWVRYIFFRRLLRTVYWVTEWKSWQSARSVCREKPSGWSLQHSTVQLSGEEMTRARSDVRVSVVIPTLGRYAYIRGALDSLLEQSISVTEVIVVDQNLPQDRQPDVYNGYEKLNLKVIWQDEQGQSLARNTALDSVSGEYVFLFDDDSIAHPDLIECHLEPLLSGRYDVSTGVAFPPSQPYYILPLGFRDRRLSQTFDTGNSLMSLELLHRMRGLDRNYDFGPGADADLGTRLYLKGYRILHNPEAIRIHFKAQGGLRVHGADKYNTDSGFFEPYPPVTQSYYALRYLSDRQAHEAALLGFFLNKFPKELRQPGKDFIKKIFAILQFSISIILLPIKRLRSLKAAHILLEKEPRLGIFTKPSDG